MKKEQLKEITEKLENGVKELLNSDKYKEYLAFLSKFHNYSFNNTFLILLQYPTASLVAGFETWKNKHKRYVKKGEKGIKIIAPAPVKVKTKDENNEEIDKDILLYKAVTVFDISQTEGAELPLMQTQELTASVENYKDFYTKLENISPCPIIFEKIENGVKGYYSEKENKIAINEGMSELQTLKALIHEISHATLHNSEAAKKRDKKPSRNAKETEAESIAFTVLSYLGLDTSEYSFIYLASWGGEDLKELKESLEIIRDTAAKLINAISSGDTIKKAA